MIPEIRSTTDRFFSHFEPIFTLLLLSATPYHPSHPTTQRIKILKKWKKKKNATGIIILHKCTINDKHMIYGSWDINCNKQIFFVILGNFLLFQSPNDPKNENFKKKIMKEIPGDFIILHKCTKTYDHRLYYSWDMVRDKCNCCFSFFSIFFPFLPL